MQTHECHKNEVCLGSREHEVRLDLIVVNSIDSLLQFVTKDNKCILFSKDRFVKKPSPIFMKQVHLLCANALKHL